MMVAVRAAIDDFAAGAEQYDDITLVGFRRDAGADGLRRRARPPRRACRRSSNSSEKPEIWKTSATKGFMPHSTMRPSFFSRNLRTARNTRSPALETYSLSSKSATSLRVPAVEQLVEAPPPRPWRSSRVDLGGKRDDRHVADDLHIHVTPFRAPAGRRRHARLSCLSGPPTASASPSRPERQTWSSLPAAGAPQVPERDHRDVVRLLRPRRRAPSARASRACRMSSQESAHRRPRSSPSRSSLNTSSALVHRLAHAVGVEVEDVSGVPA